MTDDAMIQPGQKVTLDCNSQRKSSDYEADQRALQLLMIVVFPEPVGPCRSPMPLHTCVHYKTMKHLWLGVSD